MSNVTLTIGGRDYAVACAPGEEAHVTGLGRMIDGKLGEMPGGQPMGETRALLFAALLLADQVHELQNAPAPPAAPAPLPDPQPDRLALDRLARLAGQIEQLADAVEAGLENAGRGA